MKNQLKLNSDDFIYKKEYTINNFDYQSYNAKQNNFVRLNLYNKMC